MVHERFPRGTQCYARSWRETLMPRPRRRPTEQIEEWADESPNKVPAVQQAGEDGRSTNYYVRNEP